MEAVVVAVVVWVKRDVQRVVLVVRLEGEVEVGVVIVRVEVVEVEVVEVRVEAVGEVAWRWWRWWWCEWRGRWSMWWRRFE